MSAFGAVVSSVGGVSRQVRELHTPLGLSVDPPGEQEYGSGQKKQKTSCLGLAAVCSPFRMLTSNVREPYDSAHIQTNRKCREFWEGGVILMVTTKGSFGILYLANAVIDSTVYDRYNDA